MFKKITLVFIALFSLSLLQSPISRAQDTLMRGQDLNPQCEYGVASTPECADRLSDYVCCGTPPNFNSSEVGRWGYIIAGASVLVNLPAIFFLVKKLKIRNKLYLALGDFLAKLALAFSLKPVSESIDWFSNMYYEFKPPIMLYGVAVLGIITLGEVLLLRRFKQAKNAILPIALNSGAALLAYVLVWQLSN